MSSELIVVRHGETQWNADGRIQGHRGEGLNAHGREQARAVAERLAGEDFDALISSDLERAMETARAISALTGHPIRPDRRLREWNLGVLSGLLRADADERYPQAFPNRVWERWGKQSLGTIGESPLMWKLEEIADA